MAVNKRLLLLNTSVSYLRTAINIGFSLFTTRWLMNALGVEDYGLYFVVGGVISFLTFINTALSSGSQRFFSHSMDVGVDVVRKWFTASFVIHASCAFVILILSIPAYFIFFKYVLSIPACRRDACIIVYWCSVLVSCGCVVNTPFNAMYVAKQRIFELTLMSLILTLGGFSLTYSLFYVKADRLITYVILIGLLNYFVFIVQGVRSFCLFKEARLISFRSLSRYDFWEMISFSGWTFVDSLSFMLRGQGIQLIFNRFGTSALNAAYSVANNLACHTNILSGALTGAMSPGIISQYGIGDVKGAGFWSLRTCRLATVLALLVFVPMYLESETIVKLWLVTPPEYTVGFVRVMAVMYLVTQFVTGGKTLISARGKIGLYETCVSAFYLSAVILAWVIVKIGLPVHYAVICYLVSTVGYAVVTMVIACQIPGFEFGRWIRTNLIPGVGVLVVAMAVGRYVGGWVAHPLERCIVVTCATSCTIGALAGKLMLTAEERELLFKRISQAWRSGFSSRRQGASF